MILLLFIIHAGPTSGTPPSPPPEPDGLTRSEKFLDWDLDPNGLVIFQYSTNSILTTKRRAKTWGTIRSEETLSLLEGQWRKLGYHFLWHYNAPQDVYTFYVIFLYPLFYEYDGIVYIDQEEDGINGNEQIYEILGEHKKI